MEPVRIAVIGAGLIGNLHLRNITILWRHFGSTVADVSSLGSIVIPMMSSPWG